MPSSIVRLAPSSAPSSQHLPVAVERPSLRRLRPAAEKLLQSPQTVHPALWRGHQLAWGADSPSPTGFPELDAQLPGGGWPQRVLTELLLAHLGVGEIRLMAPILSGIQRAGRLVMLFDPPALLSGWALGQLGIDAEQLLVIQTEGDFQANNRPVRTAQEGRSNARLWALEQALKSGHVGAVIAWLPPCVRAEQMRRLQLAAHAHDGPAFMLRDVSAQHQPSAAPLRLSLRAGAADELAIHIVKRRGPPLVHDLRLALPAILPSADRRSVRVIPCVLTEATADMRLRSAAFVNLA